MFFRIIKIMALVKTGQGITDIRGQLGGVYFSRDKTGLHERAMPRNWRKLSYTEPFIRPNSPRGSRAVYIDSWTAMIALWKGYISIVLLPAWIAKSISEYFHKGKAKGKRISAYNWFMYYNIPRSVRAKQIYTYPPRAHNDLPEYVLTGKILEPTAQNLYKAPGQYYGHDYYVREGSGDDVGLGFLWYKEGFWYITSLLGDPLPLHYWYLDSDDPAGAYTEVGGDFGVLNIEL